MRGRFFSWLLILLGVAALAVLWSCNPDQYGDLYGYWQVDSITNRNATGTLSEPWIKLSSDALVTFVYYDSAQWRHCTMRSGSITSLDGASFTFTEDEGGATRVVPYSFDGTTLSITWPDDGEVYAMTRVTALPYAEDTAVSSACFN